MGFWLTAATNTRPLINRQETQIVPTATERKRKAAPCKYVDGKPKWRRRVNIMEKGWGKLERMRRAINKKWIIMHRDCQYTLKQESFIQASGNPSISLAYYDCLQWSFIIFILLLLFTIRAYVSVFSQSVCRSQNSSLSQPADSVDKTPNTSFVLSNSLS